MSEQSKFENEWKNAFEGAEMTPPVGVWSNVRAEVASDEAQKQSKRALYWRWMAAASVTVLLAASTIGYYYYQGMIDDYQLLAQQEQLLLQEIKLMEEDECEKEATKAMIAQQATLAMSAERASEIAVNADGEITSDTNEENITLSQPAQLANANQSENSASSKVTDNVNSPIKQDKEKSLSESYGIASNNDIKSIDEKGEVVGATLTTEQISLLERLESGLLAEITTSIQPQKVPDLMEIIKMQNGSKENFRGMWAGLSVGGGSYESNINRGGNSEAFALTDAMIEGITSDGQSLQLKAQDVNQANAETPAFSYAISADFGKQIGRRTYLQGGVEYSRYSSGATSNVVTSDANNESQAFLRYNNSASLDEGVLTTTDSYQLTNNFEYVAVPLKLGYKLLDRKIGISLSSGIATNFFLKNTLKDKSGVSEKVEVTNGQSSPYKPLNFNGLFGAEISYQWNEHYQLALVPDYRFSLDGVTKSDAYIQSNPTAFFLGFRFKYILK